MINIKTKHYFPMGDLSGSTTPWHIKYDTEYELLRREDAGKYWLTDGDGKHISFLLERDLLVLFEEEDLFMANLCGIEPRLRL